MDNVSNSTRSEMMRSIKVKNTKPEMIVRRLLHSAGYRYRANYPKIVGKPDLSFIKRKMVVFVHGCFWHRHPGCPRSSMPSTNVAFWKEKFRKNRERDEAVLRALQEEGWTILTIWECEVKNTEFLMEKLRTFLGPPKYGNKIFNQSQTSRENNISSN